MTNPLLDNHALPPFETIQAEHVVPAIKVLVEESEKALDGLFKGGKISWQTLVVPIEHYQDKINQAWSPISHLNSVLNSDPLREAYEEADQLLTDYYTRFGQNRQLYVAYQQIAASTEFNDFEQPMKQCIDNAIRDFKLSGVALEGEAKEEYKRIKSELSSLNTKFSNNVLDATNGWHHHVESDEGVAGLPSFLVESSKSLAQEKGLSGYLFTLDLPVYMTVMTQSESKELRQTMYEAFSTRASDRGPKAGEWDNTDLIDAIMIARKRQAELLGYDNYAEVSIASKMAKSPEQVIAFLEDLAIKTKPFAEKELEELNAFARTEYGIEELNAWDIPYYSEQLKIKKYDVSQESLRPYFPLDVVKQGLFQVARDLYGIDVRPADASTWHDHASYYEIFKEDKKIASFYFDLYARPKKRGGAWMAECRTRRVNNDELQLPVAFLVCNFNAPVDGKPSLLTHMEVTTLFHEFGHGLHHMLTKMDVAAVSGITGVEWDAVELPSQFMENFCWQPEVLTFLSKHHETDESLPDDLLQNMLAAKNFQSAMQMLRQLEFALFDLRLHMEYGKESFSSVQALLDDVRKKVAVLIPPEFNKFQNGFSHIFAGGYAAGYYSYKWAEVLSADAFSAFEEEGIFNQATGTRFMREILEKGGSESAMVLFKNFRGREPDPQALMRHSGLSSSATA